MLTVAICTFNRSDRLVALTNALNLQDCPIPNEILFINNNSSDETAGVLEHLQSVIDTPIRVIFESQKGIVYARNRAIAESMDSRFLVFIDDDEIPEPGMLSAAAHALTEENADCVGGPVRVIIQPRERPKWLEDDLLCLLAEIDYGNRPFWNNDPKKPFWTANIAYNMDIFRNDPGLRFDPHYNRIGIGIGGGEDSAMFRELIHRNFHIRYRPDMIVSHYVEKERLTRRNLIQSAYSAGKRSSVTIEPSNFHTLFGIPRYIIRELIVNTSKTFLMYVLHKPGRTRQLTRASHRLGLLAGIVRNRRNN